AAKCKATPLKTVMSLIDWEGEDDGDEIVPEESERDWSPEGVWETMPEAEPQSPPAPAAIAAESVDEATANAMREEIRRRVHRLAEAGQHEHVARIMQALKEA